jgi:hypothetical protein
MGDEVDDGEALVLVGYAATMEAVQRVEFALKRLAITQTESPEGISYEDAWARAEKILRSPVGRLKTEVPTELVHRVRRLRWLRNRLAHEVLLHWRLDTRLELATHDEVVDGLVETEREFFAVGQLISELADENLRLQGVDPEAVELSPGELREILGGG